MGWAALTDEIELRHQTTLRGSTVYDLCFGPVRWRVSYALSIPGQEEWGGSILSPCCGKAVHLGWLQGRQGSDHMRCFDCGKIFRPDLAICRSLMDGRPTPWDLAASQPEAFLWWVEEAWGVDGLASEVWRARLAAYCPPEIAP